MWNPEVYSRFQVERDRPFFDLIAQLPALSPRRIVDLGCGSGHLSAELARRWPQAEVTGIDSSAEMLSKAPRLGNLQFVQADLGEWTPSRLGPNLEVPDGDVTGLEITDAAVSNAQPDLLLSNSALQWLSDHPALIPRLAAQVAPGGVFAFQVPGNFSAPSHVLLHQLRLESRWLERLGPPERGPESRASLDPQDYADLLTPLGFGVNTWETSYLHLLRGPDPVLNWVRGTALRPVLARLSAPEVTEFEAQYGERLRQAYPERPSGTPFLFRRVFVVAERTATST
jgi:trans-aconitate 2-methyltransferase